MSRPSSKALDAQHRYISAGPPVKWRPSNDQVLVQKPLCRIQPGAGSRREPSDSSRGHSLLYRPPRQPPARFTMSGPISSKSCFHITASIRKASTDAIAAAPRHAVH